MKIRIIYLLSLLLVVISIILTNKEIYSEISLILFLISIALVFFAQKVQNEKL
jgi:NADH:ubiquinone oxidoreductase subunit 6 (subunit J)